MLNASLMTIQAAMKVYMFHGGQFCEPVMSLFFRPYKLYEDITLDDVHPPFHPSMYPTNEESNSNTCLTPTYSMESDPSEPSYPSVIRFTSDSSSFAAGQAPCPGVDEGSFAPESYAMGMGEPVEEAVEIIHSEVSGMDLFYFEDDLG